MLIPALLAMALVADEGQAKIDLWPEGSPEPRAVAEMPERVEKGKDGITRHYNITAPRLVVFESTGAKRSDAAVIVVPGGGFGVLVPVVGLHGAEDFLETGLGRGIEFLEILAAVADHGLRHGGEGFLRNIDGTGGEEFG